MTRQQTNTPDREELIAALRSVATDALDRAADLDAYTDMLCTQEAVDGWAEWITHPGQRLPIVDRAGDLLSETLNVHSGSTHGANGRRARRLLDYLAAGVKW